MEELPTIEELEAILASGKDCDIQINPDGSISAVEKGTATKQDVKIYPIKTVNYY